CPGSRGALPLSLDPNPPRERWGRRPGGNPTAPRGAPRACLRRVTRTARRRHARSLRLLGAAGYFATGMFLWIGGTLAWQVWQSRANAAARPLVNLPPVVKLPPEENLARWYAASADRILDSYRASADPWLYEFDWQKAEICLERAVQLGA